ncbi:MAG: putative bifunctional diguanylate cyclase/phosphodiesterase [Pseudomonadota bacterium]
MLLKTGEVHAVEALLRWGDEEQGFIPPDRFIPVAEETGLIQPIGAWVLREACRHAMAWQALAGWPISVAVNISALQFRPELVGEVKAALETSGLAPGLLELELTESVVMRRDEDVTSLMDRLRGLGVRLSIDDFGTGYSSLAYLKTFPVDKLKIDRSFVRDIPADPNDVQIVQAMLAIARTLHLSVVAEGVENREQMEALKAMGCDAVQGFHCFRPLDGEGIARILRAGDGALGCGRADARDGIRPPG